MDNIGFNGAMKELIYKVLGKVKNLLHLWGQELLIKELMQKNFQEVKNKYMITYHYLFFLTLFYVYSIFDFEKKEVPWSWLIFGIFSIMILFFYRFVTFLLLFALFYLIYQFISIGGADVIVLAMIGAILGVKLFIVYLVVLCVISLMRVVIGYVFQKNSKNVAFIPYLSVAYVICLFLV